MIFYTPPIDHYVQRFTVEKIINNYIGNLNDDNYIFLVGEIGSGKSTLINHIINGNKGVIMIDVDGRTTMNSLSQSLLESIKVPLESWNHGKEVKIFGELCKEVHEIDKKTNKKWVPTVIFEVEGNTSKDVLRHLLKITKELTSDKVPKTLHQLKIRGFGFWFSNNPSTFTSIFFFSFFSFIYHI